MSPAIAMPLYSLLLFHPDRSNHDVEQASIRDRLQKDLHVRFREVWIPVANGHRLNGWLYQYPGASKIVLLSHGKGGCNAQRSMITALLLSNHVSVLIYDYEGYGKSDGEPSVRNAIQDGLSAHDFLVRDLKFHPDQIILFGESLGTGVSCQIASQRQCAGIVLESGFASLLDEGRRRMPWLCLYPRAWFNGMDNIAVLKKPHPPLLIIHGDNDTSVPVDSARLLYAESSEPKQLAVLHNLGHCVRVLDRQDFNEILSKFIASL